MSNVVVTWMYSSGTGENILHSQVGSASSTQRVQNFYWRCVFLLFESSSRLNSDVRHILFINKEPPDTIDGIDTRRLIRQYNITLVEFPSITKSPPDYHGAWNTQFIILDVLDWLKNNVTKDDNVFILDSDVIFNKPIDDELLGKLRDHKALLYSIDYPENQSINGLTRIELLNLAKEMNKDFPAIQFTYTGGEFIACTGSEIPRLADMARDTYRVSLERHKSGLKKFNEEAHLLSYIYQLLNYESHTANKFIKRIWTDRSLYSNVDGGEQGLTFWHLPSEKTRGFVNVFRSYRMTSGRYELTRTNFLQEYRIEETPFLRLARLLKQLVRPAHGLLKGITKRFS